MALLLKRDSRATPLFLSTLGEKHIPQAGDRVVDIAFRFSVAQEIKWAFQNRNQLLYAYSASDLFVKQAARRSSFNWQNPGITILPG